MMNATRRTLLGLVAGSAALVVPPAEAGEMKVADYEAFVTAEIWFHRFTEDDVLAGRIVSPTGRLGVVAVDIAEVVSCIRRVGERKEMVSFENSIGLWRSRPVI